MVIMIINYLFNHQINRYIRNALTLANGALATQHLPILSDELTSQLVQWIVQILCQLTIMVWGRYQHKLSFAKGAVGLESPDAQVCPKTKAIVEGMKVLILGFILTGSAYAQDNKPDPKASISGNPLGSAAISAVEALDTSSNFFELEEFSFRAGAVIRGNTAGSSTGFDVNLSKNWMVCGDVIMGVDSQTFDAISLQGGYRIPIHNMEIDLLLGAGYGWVKSNPEGNCGVRFSYALSDRYFAWTQGGAEFGGIRPVPSLIAGFGIKF